MIAFCGKVQISLCISVINMLINNINFILLLLTNRYDSISWEDSDIVVCYSIIGIYLIIIVCKRLGYFLVYIIYIGY
jgi:hypothetical protein